MRSPTNLMTVGMLSLILVAWFASLKDASPNQRSNSNDPVTNQQPGNNAGLSKSPSNRNEKENLLYLIDTAVFDVGELGKQAREKLQQTDRTQLVSTLSSLRDSLREDDIRRVEIACCFCFINHEYRLNRQVIVSTFDRHSPYQNLHDDVWMMLDRLIRGGDKALLSLGFNAVEWADGALAEGLYDTFDDQLANDPANFLKVLVGQPKKVRGEVYNYIFSDMEKLPNTDFDKLKRYLESVPRHSPLSSTAKEFDAALSAKTKAEPHQEKKSGAGL
jgi:hypothetical protein